MLKAVQISNALEKAAQRGFIIKEEQTRLQPNYLFDTIQPTKLYYAKESVPVVCVKDQRFF